MYQMYVREKGRETRKGGKDSKEGRKSCVVNIYEGERERNKRERRRVCI